MSWTAKIEHENCGFPTPNTTQRGGHATKLEAYEWAAGKLSYHNSTAGTTKEKLTITVTKEECDHFSSYSTVRRQWIAAARAYLDAAGPLYPTIVDGVDLLAPYDAVKTTLTKFEKCQSCGEKL